MLDLNRLDSAEQLWFYTDLSSPESLGFGGVYENQWFFGKWEPGFITECKLSIAFLELYALVTGMLIWSNRLQNICMVVFCDNQSVVQMVNQMISKCPNCMYLIRLLVFAGMTHNRRVFRWFKFTLKPPYSIGHDNLRLAIWDTSF